MFDYALVEMKSTEQNYFQKVKNYMKNMKDGVKNSKFVQRCVSDYINPLTFYKCIKYHFLL